MKEGDHHLNHCRHDHHMSLPWNHVVHTLWFSIVKPNFVTDRFQLRRRRMPWDLPTSPAFSHFTCHHQIWQNDYELNILILIKTISGNLLDQWRMCIRRNKKKVWGRFRGQDWNSMGFIKHKGSSSWSRIRFKREEKDQKSIPDTLLVITDQKDSPVTWYRKSTLFTPCQRWIKHWNSLQMWMYICRQTNPGKGKRIRRMTLASKESKTGNDWRWSKIHPTFSSFFRRRNRYRLTLNVESIIRREIPSVSFFIFSCYFFSLLCIYLFLLSLRFQSRNYCIDKKQERNQGWVFSPDTIPVFLMKIILWLPLSYKRRDPATFNLCPQSMIHFESFSLVLWSLVGWPKYTYK